jgi:hypothetical protein
MLLLAMALVAAGGLAVRLGFGQLLGQPPAGPRPADARAPGAGELSIDMTEAALTDEVNTRLAGRSLGQTPFGVATVKRLGIRLLPDHVEADGDAAVGPTTVPLSLAGTVSVLSGAPVVSLWQARAAGMPLPEQARALLEHSVQSDLQAVLDEQRVRLLSVTLGSGKLTVVGSRY